LWSPDVAEEVKVNRKTYKLLHKGPNVWLIEDFLTAKQMNWLRELSERPKLFKPSVVDIEDGKSAVYDDRTSSSAIVPQSAEEAALKRQICDTLGVFGTQVEPLQLVKYTRGQKFDVHHDATIYNEAEETLEAPSPGKSFRKYTIFAYLTDVSAAHGGETTFPKLKLTVRPVGGQALIWRNVNDKDEFDMQLIHQGLPYKGPAAKIGLNVWIHNKDIRP